MAANAVSLRGGHVRSMFEPQMLPRELGAAAHVHLAVTVFAAALVVRLRVAAHAGSGVRKVHRIGIARRRDPFVARETADSFEDVGAMFEGMRGLATKAERPCARADEEHQRQHERTPIVHGISSVRAIRKRPVHSKR
jgi:hypothetical protein